MKLFPAFLLCLLLLLPSPAPAGPLEDGNAAYDARDYGKALKLWRPLAEGGDAEAQYDLGYMYLTGSGVPQNFARALGWFSKSAAQGNDSAEGNLGWMYERGEGVPQDRVQAYSYYFRAAKAGNRDAPAALRRVARGLTAADIAAAKRLAEEQAPGKENAR